MTQPENQRVSINLSRLGTLLPYLIIVAVLLSPQFSVTGVIGPDGILRADQLLIPLLIVTLALANQHNLRLPINRVSLGLFFTTAIIVTSLVVNTIFFGLNPTAGEIFDVLIWVTYTMMFMILSGNLSPKNAERSFTIALVISVLIGILALLQAMGNSFAVHTLGPIFTERLARLVTAAPTATTSNPNTLAKLVLFPLFVFFALMYRNIVGDHRDKRVIQTLVWGGLSILFGVVIVLSNSRSGLIAAIIGLTVIGGSFLSGRVGKARRREAAISGVAALGIVLLYLVIFVFEAEQIANLNNPLQDNSLQIRFRKWQQVLPIILKQPIFGHGPTPRFRDVISVVHIDSGVLSWWYHYGLLGVIGYFYIVIGAVRMGIRGLTDEHLFQNCPLIWSAAVSITGWFCGTLVVWTVVGVPQSRRVFTFALLVVTFVAVNYCQDD